MSSSATAGLDVTLSRFVSTHNHITQEHHILRISGNRALKLADTLHSDLHWISAASNQGGM